MCRLKKSSIVNLLLTSFLILSAKLSLQSDLPTFEDLEIPEVDNIDIGDVGGDGVGGDATNLIQPASSLAGIGSILKAVALIRGPRVHGIVRLVQIGMGPTIVSGVLAGLNPFSLHGFHVHEYRANGGDCESAGEHYNPTQQTHGSPDSIVSHVGDLGNLQADGLGVSRFHISSHKISLKGKFSVIERALVVHQRPDDLGMGYNRESLKSGNSGGRIGCGTIKFVSIG